MKRIWMSLVSLLAVWTAQAQSDLLAWGVTAGANITRTAGKGEGFMHTGWDFDSQGGYYVGLMAKVSLPLTGFGLDGGLLYSQEVVSLSTHGAQITDKLRYYTVPVHLRYDLEVADGLLVPFGFVGPQCSFALNDFDWYRLFSMDALSAMTYHDPADNKTTAQLWKLDLGFGLMLGSQLQVSYCYSVPLNAAFTFKTVYDDARENFHTGTHRVGATYYF